MKLPEIFPPADLLERVEGVKRGLRQRRRLGRLGWSGFLLASAIQIVVVAANSPFAKAAYELEWPTLLKFAGVWWPYLLPAFAIVLFLVVANWARFWLKESKAPFRYTCSVGDFRQMEGGDPAVGSNWSWLADDLKQRLNERIGRLRFIDEKRVKPDAGFESHIHLGGSYGIRKDRRDRWVVDVRPSVRIGSPEKPEMLAHLVSEELEPTADDAPPTLAGLSAPLYDRILERVFFSVSSQLYRQIRRDVTERIELLPTDYFRAVALFYEARDYSRSNTLDAYQEAGQLYWRSIELLDPSLRPLPHFLVWRATRWVVRAIRRGVVLPVRGTLAYLFPRLGRVQVLCARAEIGYATMILYQRDLAGQSGQLLNTVFEARPVAERALARLERLPKDVPRRHETMFDAHVVLALACSRVFAQRNCKQHLEEACRMDPYQTLMDVRYLFADGQAEHQRMSKVQTLRRVVEREPRFESAQFALAFELEMLWRSRRVFERIVAEMIFEEYDKLSKINPSNLAACANRGYVRWLLGEEQDLALAQKEFERRREFKEIKQETFVAELDYGQVRIAAEVGDFQAAFKHYTAAVPAMLALGHVTGEFESYYFAQIGESMFQRFARYHCQVKENWERWKPFDEPSRSFTEWVNAIRIENDDGRPAADRLVELLIVVVQRLSDADRATVERVIERHAECGADLRDGLPGLARVFTGSCTGPAVPVRTAALAALGDEDLRRVVRRVTDMAATRRARNVILAFALNDYGGACFEHYKTTGDERSREAARQAFGRSADLNPEYIMPYYNLHMLVGGNEPEEVCRQRLERLITMAPEWPTGRMAFAEYEAGLAVQHALNAAHWRDQAEDNRAKAQVVAEARREAWRQDRAGDRGSFAREPGEEEERLVKQAEQFDQEADKDELKSRQSSDVVIKHLSEVLPHEWLWQERNDGVPQFRWSALDDRELSEKLTWERECSELQVSALRALTKLPTTAGSQSNTGRLAKHLRDRFWPDDFVVNLRLRELSIADVRSLVRSAAFMAIFSNPAHQRLVADDEVRTLLQRGAWARLLRKHPTAFLLLLQAGFPVWRSRIYRALLDIPEIRNLPKAAVGLYLRHIEPENVVQLLRGPGYDELSKDGRKRQPPRRRQLRSRLRSREFRRLLDYAEYNTTTRWNIEHWIEDQQYPYSALTWLTDLSFFGELHSDRSANLERASQLEGRVPAFYYRVGELLERRAAGAPGAVEAYLKAIDSDDPQILHKLGVRLKDLGQLDASLRAFRRGLENDPDCRLIAEWQHRSAAASVLWAQGSLSEAIDELERIKHASDVSWRSQVVEAMSDAVKSAAEARLLRDWLDSVRPRGDPAIREHGALADFHEAMLSLAARRDEPRPAQAWIPVVTPVALEIQVRLIPREDGWEAEHPLFKECMPKMRARIEREMGVRVPGVRVRSDKDAPAGSYTILLDEVSEITGVVFANAFFCSSAETVTRLSKGKPPLGAGVDPLTGRAGAWIAVSDVKGAARAKAEMWDPFEYMVRHVEAVLRGRLDTFVGVQELQDMLDSWELHLQAAPDQAPEEDGTTPSRHDLIARALPDTAARLQLLQVLQRLLRDRVPIADLRTILEVFASRSSMEVSDAHLIEVTEAIRLRLRKSLPGNRAESLFVYLAPEIEAGIDAHITESDGRRHLALPAADRTALLKAIRRTFDGLPAPDPVIVTRRDGIRPNVNELVAPENPTQRQ
jgi:tetratricopeptide (TPR) repeat protein